MVGMSCDRRLSPAAMRFAAALAVALCLMQSAPARADLAAAINRARAADCDARGAPLGEDLRMRAAAERVAAGATLDVALRESGVIASRSTLFHLSGVERNADVARELARHACGTLSRSGFRSIGAIRDGDEAWIVLATAISLPPPADEGGIERRIWRLINEARAHPRRCGRESLPPAPPLALSQALTSAALVHSRDMAVHRRFRHSGSHGSTPAMRVRRAGFGPYRLVGENIAAGAMTPAGVVRGWLGSPGHCRNIMDARFTETGIAYALDPSGPYGIYWTQDFATPAAASPSRRVARSRRPATAARGSAGSGE